MVFIKQINYLTCGHGILIFSFRKVGQIVGQIAGQIVGQRIVGQKIVGQKIASQNSGLDADQFVGDLLTS